MNKETFIINIIKDGENFQSIKLNVFETLLNIRNSISTKFNLSNFYFIKKNSSLIEKNIENEIILSEILIDNNTLYIKTDSNLIEIKVFLDQKQIYKINFSKNEKVKNFINIISNKIPNDSILVLNGFEIDVKEIENDDIINILDKNNNIYFISSKQNENIPINNENNSIQSKEKIIINFGKNSI